MEFSQAFNYVDFQTACKIVTNGTAMFESEYLAGQYAFEAVNESDNRDFCEDSLCAHLDILQEGGAEFDYAAALEIAQKFVAAQENDDI